MKLTKEELAEIAEIDGRLISWANHDIRTFVNDCEYLRCLVDKLRLQSHERFTYEYRKENI